MVLLLASSIWATSTVTFVRYYEHVLSGEKQKPQELAKTVVVFMVRGALTNIVFPSNLKIIAAGIHLKKWLPLPFALGVGVNVEAVKELINFVDEKSSLI